MFAVVAPVPWEIEGPEGTAEQPAGEGTPVGRIALLRPGGLLHTQQAGQRHLYRYRGQSASLHHICQILLQI